MARRTNAKRFAVRPALTAMLLVALGLAAPRTALGQPASGSERARQGDGGPSPRAPEADALGRARKLIDIGGTADESDATILAREVSRLPERLLEGLGEEQVRFVVCRKSVADGVPLWKNVHVRGWPKGMNYDQVPGRGLASLRLVVIATVGHDTAQGAHIARKGEGHGSANLVFHEMAHALDGTFDLLGSLGPRFNAAREADLEHLSAYESQKGAGGREETYAESFARFYGGDPEDAGLHPNLHRFWAADPLGLSPAPRRARAARPRREARLSPQELVSLVRELGDALDELREAWRDLRRERRPTRRPL